MEKRAEHDDVAREARPGWGRMILVLGGARSGKSSFALRLAARHGERICYLATAKAGDEEMAQRILRHRRSRPADWLTLELSSETTLPHIPSDIQVVLLDCFTVYLYNLMATHGLDWLPEEEETLSELEVLRRMDEVEGEALKTVKALRRATPILIVVSNEVGWGVVPPFRLGRIFRDLAGRANQLLAIEADQVWLVVSGLPLALKDEGKEKL